MTTSTLLSARNNGLGAAVHHLCHAIIIRKQKKAMCIVHVKPSARRVRFADIPPQLGLSQSNAPGSPMCLFLGDGGVVGLLRLRSSLREAVTDATESRDKFT